MQRNFDNLYDEYKLDTVRSSIQTKNFTKILNIWNTNRPFFS